ncbi:MAG: aldo/keto reductase [Anaerolineae bacterium]|nr:aldo/keto reductase [Anaerolineae bacterium]
MEKRRLGTSEIEVSVFGLGCWPLGGGPGWGDQDERESIATVHAALDYGINFFDTAEGYNNGRSEEVLGKALEDRRDKALIATKVSPTNTEPATLRAHCEASLRRLRTDYIDLYQVHWPIWPATNNSVEDAFATLLDLQQEGKIRAIGVSNHGVEQLRQVLATGVPIVSNQLCYNLLSRAIESEILPFCREHGLGVITYMGLMQGLLAGIYRSPDEVPPFRARTRHFSKDRPMARHGEPGAEAETFAALERIRQIADELGYPMAHVALAWVASKPGISCVLVGSRKRDQLARNIEAASLKLPPEVIAKLDEATEELRIKLGPNADYWQGQENSRIR